MDDWQDCPVEGCTNKICLSLSSDKCFVHTDGNEHVKRFKIRARNAGRLSEDDIGTLFGLPVVIVQDAPANEVLFVHPDTKLDPESGAIINPGKSILLRLPPPPVSR